MAVYLLNDNLVFPSPEGASPEGILAVGGDARPERLLLAYAQGIFPWPSEGMPLLWFSPDPRFVLTPDRLHIPRSLRKTLRKGEYEVRADSDFDGVIDACAAISRPDQNGTWITDELREGYKALHTRGYAHSIETWSHGEMVGGLYGVSLGKAFFGESMFSRKPNASKVAFATLGLQLAAWNFGMIDCQIHTDHLERFGASMWPRERYLDRLRECVSEEMAPRKWYMDLDLEKALSGEEFDKSD